MVKEKVSINIQVYLVATELNIAQTVVKNVINSFFDVCKKELYEGRVVRILGFATLVPEPISTNKIKTRALLEQEVAKRTGVSFYTVDAIIQSYLNKQMKDLLDDTPVTFKALFTLTPVRDLDGQMKVYGLISPAIRDKVNSGEIGINSVRLHTCKVLRNNREGGVIY